MREKDVFKTNTWNFLQGDRQVEGLICDLPFKSHLVVRNNISNVLATIVGIKDLSTFGWVEDGFQGTILAPWNSMEFSSQLRTLSDRRSFLNDFLLELYGIKTVDKRQKNNKKQLLILMNPSQQTVEQGNSEVLSNIIQLLKSKNMIKVFVMQSGERLHRDFIPFLKGTYSSLFYNGLNVCLSAGMEEILSEVQPDSIYIAGYSDLHVVYSAIGAVDYYINSDALFRNPESLAISDLFILAKNVQILSSCTNWLSTDISSYEDHLRHHFESELKVNIDNNQLFQATRESIAIDIC